VEEWKTGRLEYWNIGTSFHYSTIPSFRVFTFHHTNIPTSQAPSVASCEEVTSVEGRSAKGHGAKRKEENKDGGSR
jgi:hypothetical protein